MTADAENVEGMTVNERLFHFELLSCFDDAVRTRNIENVIEVLRKAQFSQAEAEYTAKTILENPKRYGY